MKPLLTSFFCDCDQGCSPHPCGDGFKIITLDNGWRWVELRPGYHPAAPVKIDNKVYRWRMNVTDIRHKIGNNPTGRSLAKCRIDVAVKSGGFVAYAICPDGKTEEEADQMNMVSIFLPEGMRIT